MKKLGDSFDEFRDVLGTLTSKILYGNCELLKGESEEVFDEEECWELWRKVWKKVDVSDELIEKLEKKWKKHIEIMRCDDDGDVDDMKKGLEKFKLNPSMDPKIIRWMEMAVKELETAYDKIDSNEGWIEDNGLYMEFDHSFVGISYESLIDVIKEIDPKDKNDLEELFDSYEGVFTNYSTIGYKETIENNEFLK